MVLKRKGYTFKEAPHLVFRQYDPEIDKRTGEDFVAGSPDREFYNVVVSYKAVLRRLGKAWYEETTHEEFSEAKNNTPCIPFFGWSRTNMIYGKARKSPHGYYTRPIYWIEDGTVYQSTARYDRDPDVK